MIWCMQVEIKRLTKQEKKKEKEKKKKRKRKEKEKKKSPVIFQLYHHTLLLLQLFQRLHLPFYLFCLVLGIIPAS